MDDRPSFEVSVDDPDRVGETLVIGLSNPGMAGLTATDHVVRHGDCDRIGRVTGRGYPSVVPFEEGIPRDHSRLYHLNSTSVTLLVSELYLPAATAGAFADGVVEWLADGPVSDVVVLNGVPVSHGPDEHDVFWVATDEFRDRRLADGTFQPLGGGMLHGPAGELISKALEGTAPPTGVYLTPTHPPGPDVDAAIRFLGALEETHGVDVDVSELHRLSEDVNRYYAEMAQRMSAMEERPDRDYPDDVAFM